MKLQFLAGIVILATAPGFALAQQSHTVNLGAQNGSGETGTAKFTAEGTGTKVEINLKGAPKTAQPAHIHEGTCANLNPKPKHGLANVVDGKSTTTIPVSYDTLMKEKGAVNVHKSTDDLKTYVACGDIAESPAKK